MTGVISSFNFW